jgi:RNA polymerase sigma-70 factor (ECF subfamily)
MSAFFLESSYAWRVNFARGRMVGVTFAQNKNVQSETRRGISKKLSSARSWTMLTASKPLTPLNWPMETPDPEHLNNLVAICQQGNREAQQQLYECCYRRVFLLVVQMVGRREAADVLQQVFLQVFRALDQFDSRSRFETWLYRVTMNEALQHARRQRRWRWTSLVSDLVDHKPNHASQLDLKDLLEQALARLDLDLRSLYLLREVEKLTYAEIAEVTQIPEGTVASRLNRARQFLKQHLLELGWEQ